MLSDVGVSDATDVGALEDVGEGVSTGLVEDTPVLGGTTSLLVDEGVAEALSVEDGVAEALPDEDETLAVVVVTPEEAAVTLLEDAELAA
jgi:hypothetical protein